MLGWLTREAQSCRRLLIYEKRAGGRSRAHSFLAVFPKMRQSPIMRAARTIPTCNRRLCAEVNQVFRKAASLGSPDSDDISLRSQASLLPVKGGALHVKLNHGPNCPVPVEELTIDEFRKYAEYVIHGLGVAYQTWKQAMEQDEAIQLRPLKPDASENAFISEPERLLKDLIQTYQKLGQVYWGIKKTQKGEAPSGSEAP